MRSMGRKWGEWGLRGGGEGVARGWAGGEVRRGGRKRLCGSERRTTWGEVEDGFLVAGELDDGGGGFSGGFGEADEECRM